MDRLANLKFRRQIIARPEPRERVHAETNWFLPVGGMTALSAISGYTELLPKIARGMAVTSVMDEEDVQDIEKPEKFGIEWVVNAFPGTVSDLLLERVRGFDWLKGNPTVWAAWGFSGMRLLRDFFCTKREDATALA